MLSRKYGTLYLLTVLVFILSMISNFQSHAVMAASLSPAVNKAGLHAA